MRAYRVRVSHSPTGENGPEAVFWVSGGGLADGLRMREER